MNNVFPHIVEDLFVILCMKRIALILLFFISCSTIPRITYEGERNQEGEYHGKGVITYSNGDK